MPYLFELEERQAQDMVMDEGCCHKDSSEKEWDANESTFISYLPEPDQSIDMIRFDQTFENMDADMNESGVNSTLLRPHGFLRSRFISACAFDKSAVSKAAFDGLQPIE